MSKHVSIDELFDGIEAWGAGFVATLGDDERVRLVALRPTIVTHPDGRVLHFAQPGVGTLNNAAIRDRVSVAFPPHPESDGFSMIVDGIAEVDRDHDALELRPLTAVLHRPAP